MCVCAYVCVSSGGRTIVVTGSGFDIIQSAVIKVQAMGEDWSGIAHKESEVSIHTHAHTHTHTPLLLPPLGFIQNRPRTLSLSAPHWHPSPRELTSSAQDEPSLYVSITFHPVLLTYHP